MTKKQKLPRVHFKRQPRETGLASVGNPHAAVDIFIDNKLVGYIQPPAWNTKDNYWRIRVMLPTRVGGVADWKWVTLLLAHPDEATARAWCKSKLSIMAATNPDYFHYEPRDEE